MQREAAFRWVVVRSRRITAEIAESVLCSKHDKPTKIALSEPLLASRQIRHLFFESNQVDVALLAAVETMLTTAPLSYICTRGLQDTLCVHERRQHRNAGTKYARQMPTSGPS